jgi:hypothetical protein
VVDESTHLMWARDEEAGEHAWGAAEAACASSRRAGFSDWRLPSSNELMSLVDYARAAPPVIDPDVFVGGSFPAPTTRAWLWSSTPFVKQPGMAWALNGSGGVYAQPLTDALYVRCVR